MNIRTYRPGDEQQQLDIYNAAAAGQSKFKPANLQELQRRVRSRDFDPATRFYAEDAGRVVGYATFQENGRVSYPWTLPGSESVREPLFAAVLDAMKKRGLPRAFCAYRGDWPAINSFFRDHGFGQVREMVNFSVTFMDMPTPAARPNNLITPLRPEDVPATLALGAGLLRLNTAAALESYFFRNPYFTPESLFALRSRQDNTPVAVGILIDDPAYAAPEAVDPQMPCFRLGAIGTEGMTTKRIRGLFSFLARPDKTLLPYGMDLLSYATQKLDEHSDLERFAAQAPSDVPALLAFYQRHFREQGRFPVLERAL